jgi:hypothetical protein
MGEEHVLWIDADPLKDQVDPCISVSCAEIVGNNLWLGTRYDGEYGEYPANGIVVQTLDNAQLVKKLSTAHGLTGDLIRVIRLDPFDNTIWVATNEGINVVSQDFRVLQTFFFDAEVNPESGMPEVVFSPTKRKDDPMTVFVGLMHTSDAKKFYAAAISIPPGVVERFTNEMLEEDEGGQNDVDGRQSVAFAPKEMNVLAPLYIEDAMSSDDQVRAVALSHICLFNDQRVIDYLMELGKRPETAPLVRRCLEKFTRSGLLSEQQKNDHAAALLEQKNAQIASMLEQERDALDKIRASTFESTTNENRLVVKLAKDLKEAGDLRGMDLINEYFQAADGNRNPGNSDTEHAQMFRDAKLYDWIGVNLRENEVAPAMLEGLAKLRIFSFVSRTGCGFFDMRWPSSPPLFDAKYAEATLIAMDRRRPETAPPPGAEDFCAEAFKSQLGNARVHEAFFKDVYPQLTPGQQELADKLSKEPPAPLGGY